MWIQIILIAALIVIAAYLARSTPSYRHLAIRRVVIFAAIIAAVVAILIPGWTSALAHLVGIGRGADLLLYGLIVTFMLYAVADFKKTVKQERTVSRLAKALTLTEARLEDALAKLAPAAESYGAGPLEKG